MSEISNEKDFFRDLSLKTGVTQKEVRKVYYGMLDIIAESANSADSTYTRIPNFGVLEVTIRNARVARDPRNSKAVLVPVTRRFNLRLLPKFKNKLSVESYKESNKK